MLIDKNQKSICLLFLLFFFASMHLSAQVPSNIPPNEISFHLGGGLPSIHYQNAPRSGFFNGYAVDLGIGYTLLFHKNWGIYLGLEHGIYNTRKLADFDLLTSRLTDQNGYIFDLHSTTSYSEAFKTAFLNVPLMFLFQTTRGNIFETWSKNRNLRQGFYAMGGVRTAIPIRDNYESRITSLTYSAYYPEIDNWGATQNFAGLGNHEGYGYNGDIELEMSWRLSLEAGFKWRLSYNFVIYTGAFCDIGLNNPIKNIREPFRNHIAIDHITNFTLLEFPNRANIVIAGIKLRLALSRLQKGHCPYNPYRELKTGGGARSEK